MFILPPLDAVLPVQLLIHLVSRLIGYYSALSICRGDRAVHRLVLVRLILSGPLWRLVSNSMSMPLRHSICRGQPAII